ncbi:Zinc finger RING-type [Arabidopsis thaliana x Arabidopsis arenosa]|uniref:RING-type E3 ubiquitin transferase n=1 Tax=Arabidopsis thaliana x Arabidopsis arenosa TaxID=1240361 RepID=A0A8T2C3Z5_9BRAS|nr:Zinc finger RING-type [Arabidopsis thaliana x Arabidopsis arenosa]
MQGERASLGSLSEALNFEHGSTSSNAVIDQQIRWENIHNYGDNELQDYMSLGADTNPTFANSVYHEQRGLHRFNIGEASSSGTKNDATSHTEQWKGIGRFEERPLFVQPSNGSRVVRNVNLNAEYNEHLEDMNPVTGHPGHFEVNGLRSGLLPENSGVRAGSSVDGRRASCKRKALDASIGQSSSSGGFREFQHGESSSWISAPAYYSQPMAASDLNISLDHGRRGLVSGAVPNLSAPGITESSSRNYSVWVNPADQQETVSPSVFAAGSVSRQPVVPSLNSPGLLPTDQQLIDLRYGHALGNFASQNPNAPATHMPPVSRNTFQWNASPVAAGLSSVSATPVDRNVIHRDETRHRSNSLEIPLFVPAPELRNVVHGHISRNTSGARHVASSSSRTSVQPSPSSPALNPYQNNSPHNQRRLSEHFRRSLLSSLATHQRAARSLVPPSSPDDHVLQSGGVNTSQVHNRASSRAGPRQGQNATGIPHSLRGLASTSRGRSRMGAAEIRTVLEHMRRAGNLRFEDVMLLNQSMVLGVADIHDRYRDMRLDVDNMTYEELLSLEERIGDVCTGLNEETISNRLKQQKYKSSTSSPQEVEPCCICQEEYKEGEDIGMLECGHDFHSQCIKEWLKQKNLCPICKTTGLNTADKPRR